MTLNPIQLLKNYFNNNSYILALSSFIKCMQSVRANNSIKSHILNTFSITFEISEDEDGNRDRSYHPDPLSDEEWEDDYSDTDDYEDDFSLDMTLRFFFAIINVEVVGVSSTWRVFDSISLVFNLVRV